MNKKLEVVDFLRGFAIFTIAMMHLVQGSLEGALNKAASFGGAGVHVFILCSGLGFICRICASRWDMVSS